MVTIITIIALSVFFKEMFFKKCKYNKNQVLLKLLSQRNAKVECSDAVSSFSFVSASSSIPPPSGTE